MNENDWNRRFQPRRKGDVLRLVRGNPLAWMLSGEGETFQASLMPFRPWRLQGDTIVSLAGHLPRAHPQFEWLQQHPRANLLFLGAHGYVSSSWLDDRTQTPTWNFVSARFEVRIEFLSDSQTLRALLADLIVAMESGQEQPWRLEEMGERYEQLAARIAGFFAHVVEVTPRFKLGQNEPRDLFADMCRGLGRAGHRDLVEWMRDQESVDSRASVSSCETDKLVDKARYGQGQ